MVRLIATFFFVSLTFLGFTQDCVMRLSGHVEDADTKEKLQSATVTLINISQSTITNTNGDFAFTNLCAGEYTILVTHIDCEPYEQTILLEANRHVDIFVPHTRHVLGEVVVEALKAVPNTGFKLELSGRELEAVKNLSISEALSKLNGVTLLQTGSTISKPVIHGLHSNRILTINNGVRQEGQQWGNEHAPEIDTYLADRLVVIKGVDELKYGSDAIAGVILMNTRPLMTRPGYKAEFNTGYFTNNQQYIASGMYEQQFKNLPALTYRLQGTFKKAANVSTPNYRLNNTATQEINFSGTLGWRKEHYDIEAFYSQFNTDIGIFRGSHIGNLTDLQNAIAAEKPDNIFLGERSYAINRPSQNVVHQLFKLKSVVRTGLGKFNIQFASQQNKREEMDVVRGNTTGPQMRLTVRTFTEDIAWEHPKLWNLQGSIGLSAMQQDNTYFGRYLIPNYTSTMWGAYWIEKWYKHDWEIQGGLRYDHKTISTIRYPFNQEPVEHTFTYSTLGASLNAVYKITDGLKANIGVTVASRAPYVNELLSDGIHHGTATYETGFINRANAVVPNVPTEQSTNISAGFNYVSSNQKWQVDVNLYNNMINNFIFLQPLPDEPVLTVAGAFPQLRYQQTDAVLRGVDLSARYVINTHWSATVKTAIVRARNKKLDDWLIGIPADRVTSEVSYLFKDYKKFSASFITVEAPFVFKQTRMPNEALHGRQDYALPPSGYFLLALSAGTTMQMGNVPVTFGVSARNLLNAVYRDYLNSFRYFTDEMGRNIGVRIKVPIEKLL